MSFTLTIRERSNSWAGRGPMRSEHATRSEAEAELLEYVRRNWDAEIGTAPPDDPEDMIHEYFSDVLETYEIMETAS